MSPKEVDDLITVINNSNHPSEDRVHTYSLLSELWYITNHIAPLEWDSTISYLVCEEIISQILRPVPDNHWAWHYDLVPAPEGALHYVPNHLTAGLGVNTSDAMLDLQQVLQQLPHHNRPGGCNPILGVIFNYAFQVELHSTFGYMLGRILSLVAMDEECSFSIICQSWCDLSFMTRPSHGGIKRILTGHLYQLFLGYS